MKVLPNSLAMVCLLLMAACQPSSTTTSGNIPLLDTASTMGEKEIDPAYLIGDRRAGDFAIGDEIPGNASLSKYKVRHEQLTRTTEEGAVTEPVTIITSGQEDILILKPNIIDGTDQYGMNISEIVILSDKFKTKENIGIGSTISEFRAVYPDAKFWYTYVSGMYVVETDKVKAQFLLDSSDFVSKKPVATSERTDLMPEDFSETGRVRRVRVL